MKKSSWLILLVLAFIAYCLLRKKRRENQTLMKTDRYHLIDTLRGFALINMFVYHTLWSMANIFHYKISWFPSFYTYLWQQSGALLFIILSGFCWALSKKHLKRSLVALSCALFILYVHIFSAKAVLLLLAYYPLLVQQCLSCCRLLKYCGLSRHLPVLL